MKRTAIAALALLAAFPATASADTVDGVVVARDAQRGIVVTAGRGGAVAALRVQRAGTFKPGVRVRARATQLGDGTYRAARVRRRGRVAAAKARFTVLARAERTIVVSAGGTTFALRAGRAAVPNPGAIVAARVRVARGKATLAKVRQIGQAATLELNGRFAGFADGVLRLDVGAAVLAVTVPAGVEPELQPGDEVELLVDGSFRLIAIDGELEVHGAVTAVAAGSLRVGAVTCAVPEDLDVSDVAVGDTVWVLCSLVDGVLTADELELDDPGLEEGEPVDEEEELEPEE
jgi:hypothetical protein